ncbi:hypothetical protein E2C01_062079 [Portunus trituberculatus]|uniref:Secreted protein n=1 Tax=Portunus trituberculatus TaxID=210409 RepID=A0A5B7HCM7_PORTR|nr:hypothetical protein [Portunus trituberculatus]
MAFSIAASFLIQVCWSVTNRRNVLIHVHRSSKWVMTDAIQDLRELCTLRENKTLLTLTPHIGERWTRRSRRRRRVR